MLPNKIPVLLKTIPSITKTIVKPVTKNNPTDPECTEGEKCNEEPEPPVPPVEPPVTCPDSHNPNDGKDGVCDGDAGPGNN